MSLSLIETVARERSSKGKRDRNLKLAIGDLRLNLTGSYVMSFFLEGLMLKWFFRLVSFGTYPCCRLLRTLPETNALIDSTENGAYGAWKAFLRRLQTVLLHVASKDIQGRRVAEKVNKNHCLEN
jgi:hypothetical protein